MSRIIIPGQEELNELTESPKPQGVHVVSEIADLERDLLAAHLELLTTIQYTREGLQAFLKSLATKFIERQELVSFVDSIRGLIALKMVELEIFDKPALISPMAAMILRFISSDSERTEDAPLTLLRSQVMDDKNPNTRFKKAIILGDLSSHCAAGFGKFNMNTGPRRRYCGSMALSAYNIASSTAKVLREIFSLELIDPLTDRKNLATVLQILLSVREAIEVDADKRFLINVDGVETELPLNVDTLSALLSKKPSKA